MKKRLVLLFIVVLAAVMAFAVAGCTDISVTNSGGSGSEGNSNL